MVRATERLAVLSAEAPMHQPLMADGSALFQLQEEMRNAFECLVIDLPRTMMVHHPHLLADVQSVVAVTDLSLAGTRDTIRLLAWLRSNRSEEHTSELQSLMRISYAVFCLKKKNKYINTA